MEINSTNWYLDLKISELNEEIQNNNLKTILALGYMRRPNRLRFVWAHINIYF